MDFTGELHAVASVSTPRSLDFRRGYDGVEWKLKGSSTVKYTVEVSQPGPPNFTTSPDLLHNTPDINWGCTSLRFVIGNGFGLP